eukprot:SAG31_NODE_46700_length_253_cov_0.675325_1_plen_58_part_01
MQRFLQSGGGVELDISGKQNLVVHLDSSGALHRLAMLLHNSRATPSREMIIRLLRQKF